MMFTEEMLAEDEKRWAARDVVTELGYCGKYMRDRKDITNLDIRFYAYIMRKAHDMLKKQEPVEPYVDVDVWKCGNCGHELEDQKLIGDNILFHEQYAYCPNCGRPVKYND